VKPTF